MHRDPKLPENSPMALLVCPACHESTSEFNVECSACGARLPEPTLDSPKTEVAAVGSRRLEAGMVVAQRFCLEAELARGGMGSVWRAHDQRLDVPCAVKFVLDEVAAVPDVRRRFEREARAAARLRSAHVVGILDHGVWEDQPYLAMELLEGVDLAGRLASQPRLSRSDTVRIVSQVARGLVRAHKLGIIHRDLKPENVFLVREDDGEIAKILDFGIAKHVWTGTSPGKGSHASGLVGTPSYMSPEQASGNRPIDFRTDLWSLAVIAFRCVTGRLPFTQEAVGELLVAILSGPIPVPSRVAPAVPASFDAWWAKAAARDPDQRFSGAVEMADALREALLGQGTAGRGATSEDLAEAATPTPDSTGDIERAATLSSAELTPTDVALPPRSRRAWIAAPVVAVVAIASVVFVARSSGVRTVDGEARAASTTAVSPAPTSAPAPSATPAVEPSGEPVVSITPTPREEPSSRASAAAAKKKAAASGPAAPSSPPHDPPPGPPPSPPAPGAAPASTPSPSGVPASSLLNRRD